MKYYIIIMLLWTGVIQGFAQQPRLKQVNEYLIATGQPVEPKGVPEKRYNLLGTLYNEQKKLMLTLPGLESCGVHEVIPFGFRLSPASEIELVRTKLSVQGGNIAESTVRPFFNKSVFSGVSYLFCDSVVYGITLFYDVRDTAKRMIIEKDLNEYFRKFDYRQGEVVVYSDLDYAVKLLPGKVELYSLFHFPVVETFYPGVSHKVWYGPCCYGVDEALIMLAFYNQESKENNIQSAFKISYRYPAEKSFKMNLIRFILDDVTYDFPLEVEHRNAIDGGKMIEECDTRTFIFPEILRAMNHSKVITVELVGEGGRLLYEMPAFQRASLHTAYEYFRWNVTNPMVKYKAW